MTPGRMGYRDAETPRAFTDVLGTRDYPRRRLAPYVGVQASLVANPRRLDTLLAPRLAGNVEFLSPAAATARHRGGALSECWGLPRSRRQTAMCSDAHTDLQSNRVSV